MNAMTSAAEPSSVAAPRATLIVIAWIATLLMSKFTILIGKEVLALDTSSIYWLWIGVGAAMFALTFGWSAIKPLRGYFLIMAVVLALATLGDPLVRGTTIWLNIFGSDASPVITLLGERLVLLGAALVVIATLLLMGQTRADFFLVKGQPNSPAEGVNWLGKRKPLPWTRFAMILTIVLGGLFAAFMVTVIPPSFNAFVLALPLVPLAVVSAGLNAFIEELLYRAAPLSQLWNVVGKTQALLLTAVFFGFGHYYGGIPSGPIGFVQTGVLAVLLGKAMLETKGFAVPWFIHFALDAIIYSFLATAAMAKGGA